MLAKKRNAFKEKPSKQNMSLSTSTEGSSSVHEEEIFVRNEKLELCRKFTDQGHCPYGRKCKFAHGFQELRKDNTANLRYKTKQCFTFCQQGFCKFGKRCNFIHTPFQKPNAKSYNFGYQEVYSQMFCQSPLLKQLGKNRIKASNISILANTEI